MTKIHNLIFILFVVPSLLKAEFQYFNNSINYWSNSKVTSKQNVSLGKNKKEKSAIKKTEFPWHKYHNPKYKEFWKEGSHTTPAAVAETARVVSDKHSTEKQKRIAINNYKKWIEIKNKLHANFTKALMTYSNDKSNSLPPKSRQYLRVVSNNLEKASYDNKKIAFTMYFRSTCPHCKRMFDTFRELHRRGFYVEARQVDSGRIKEQKVPFAIIPATKSEIMKLSKQGITGVPFTLIFVEGKEVIPIQGYKTVNEIFNIIRNKVKKGGT